MATAGESFPAPETQLPTWYCFSANIYVLTYLL